MLLFYLIILVFLVAALCSIGMICKEGFQIKENKENKETKVIVGCETDADCNQVRYGPSMQYNNVCKSDKTCHCTKGSGTFCQNGPTNYPDPMSMSEAHRIYFASKYHRNMTVQDYINWLFLQEDGKQLSIQHFKNLKKIKSGGTLTEQDVPKFPVQDEKWSTAADYFAALYKDQDLTVRNISDGVYLAANYGEFSEFIPPVSALNRKVIGVAEKSMKQDAHELNYYVRPDARLGSDETSEGEAFRNKNMMEPPLQL